MPSFLDIWDREIKVPLGDMVDKGDQYKLELEVPGINKEKIRC